MSPTTSGVSSNHLLATAFLGHLKAQFWSGIFTDVFYVVEQSGKISEAWVEHRPDI